MGEVSAVEMTGFTLTSTYTSFSLNDAVTDVRAAHALMNSYTDAGFWTACW